MPSLSRFGNDLYTGRRSIDFIGRQRRWYAISAIVILLALGGLFIRGLNFGIEFRGGSDFRVAHATSTADFENKARTAVASTGLKTDVDSTKIGDDSVRVETEDAGGKQDAVRAALAKTFGVPQQQVSASQIGASWGSQISSKAIQALIVFLLLVAVVMAIYFRTWAMAVAGLVALLHDLVITVGIYALAGFEITPSSVIGFLTILGYSLYDTVVVFDKVRENTSDAMRTRRRTFRSAANLAVNQTLVRSINTTVVALLPILAILLVGIVKLGPGTLLDLSLALFVGIAVGAYSSIFIATPLLVDLRRRSSSVRALDREVAERPGAPDTAPAPVAGGRPEPAGSGRDSAGAAPAEGATVVAPATAPDVAERRPSSGSSTPDTPGSADPATPARTAPTRPIHEWAQADSRTRRPRR